MITPLTNDLQYPLPVDRTTAQDERNLNIGQQAAAQPEIVRATPPAQEGSATNSDTTDISRGERLLRQETNGVRGERLETSEQARSTLGKLLDQLKQSGVPGMMAQGDIGQDAVSSLLQTAPA